MSIYQNSSSGAFKCQHRQAVCFGEYSTKYEKTPSGDEDRMQAKIKCLRLNHVGAAQSPE